MSLVTSSSGIFHDIFTPLPEAQTEQDKDRLDHVADYADSADGAWDIFRLVDHVFSYVNILPSLSEKWIEVVEKIKDVANTAGIGLSIPKTIVDCNSLRRSLGNLFTLQDLPYSDPLRARKISQAVKKSFIDAVNLTSTVSQAALFIENAKIFIFEASHVRFIDGVNNLTSAISDSAELITEYFKLKQYHSPEAQPRNQAESEKLEERKRLSWMTITKDVASIGVAAIALVGIAFGVAAESALMISGVVLVLSTVWLTMKLATYFYNKIVVEAPPASERRFAIL